MKKKLSLICLCGIVLLGVCSCGNKDNDIDNNAPTPIRELKCSSLNNVKYSYEGYFLTNDNDLYVLNTEGLYSNNENCLKINNESKIIKNVENYFLGENNKRYRIVDENTLKAIDKIDNYELLFDSNVVKLESDTLLKADGKTYDIVLKDDGKLYEVKYKSLFNEIAELILYKEFNDEKILDFSTYGFIRIKYETYDVNTISYYIKTDKAIYTSTLANKECLKYADIKCKYDFQKDEQLTSKYNDIAIIGNNGYITKDGKQYQLNN